MRRCCSRCERLLPIDAFGKNRRMRDGVQRECRECWNERSRAGQRRRVLAVAKPHIKRDAFGALMARLQELHAERCSVEEMALACGMTADEVRAVLRGNECERFRHNLTREELAA